MNTFSKLPTITATLLACALGLAGCSDEEPFQSGGGTASNSGTISYKNFRFGSEHDLAVLNDNGTLSFAEAEITITIGDRNNQKLTDPHTVYFATEWGLIEPSCVTVDGECSVTWQTSSGAGFPADDLGGRAAGSPASTVVAYTAGEESFTDLNDNGSYDDTDGAFVDLDEPYIDVNNNGIYDAGTDPIIDTVNGNNPTGANGVHDIADGFFNGPGCTHSSLCSTVATSAIIWRSGTIKLDADAAATFTVGGTVSGLTGSVTLQNNGGDDEIITSDGTFTFNTEIDDGSTYAVTVSSQPAGQTCSVTNGSGTITADVTNVTVTCGDNYTVNANVSGLTGGTVVLQNNGGDNLTVNANGTSTFATQIADGNTYNVTVLTHPTGQTCTVTSGSGTISSANVTADVSCVDNTVSGQRTGTDISIGGGTLTLVIDVNTPGDDITYDGSEAGPPTDFTFATPLNNGASYAVSVTNNTTGLNCTPTGGSNGDGSGTISGPVSNIVIDCAP